MSSWQCTPGSTQLRPKIVELVTTILEDQDDFEIMTAATGDEALALCRIHPPNLVLLDLTLPDRDGFSVLRLLRRDRRTANSKVIVFTGTDSEAVRGVAIKLGADAFMAKPFSPWDLLAEISRLLHIEVRV